jgi:NAD(P)-dependent dehydrogenase (short-subunit alcohol dehydrogenase family)
MAGRLEARVALVTGGGSGIGAATVRRFVAEGARVVIADVQDAPAHSLAVELGPSTLVAPTDVAVEAQVAAAVDRAVAEFGQLDIVFANAGIIGATGAIASSRMSDVDLTFAVDLRGVFVTLKHAARVMVPHGSGAIICTSSPAGLVGGVGAHAYSAAKAGVIGLASSVAAELRLHRIRVNCVVPGATVSPMTAALVAGGATNLSRAREILGHDAPLGRAVLPEDIAAAVAFLASDDAEMITGQVLSVDAGLTTISGTSPMATGRHAQPRLYREDGRRDE